MVEAQINLHSARFSCERLDWLFWCYYEDKILYYEDSATVLMDNLFISF